MYDLIAGENYEIDDDDADEVGYEDIVGSDDVIGLEVRRAAAQLARSGQAATPKRMVKLALANIARAEQKQLQVQKMAQKNAIGLRPMQFSKAQVLPAPFDSNGTVAAGASTTINITATVLWKPERLFIPGSIASNFTLDRLQVGLQNWLLTASAVPCEAFTETATDNILRLDTLQIGQILTAVFTNRSGGPLTLRGMWKGFVAF